MIEEWRGSGFAPLYEVSDLGRVRRKVTGVVLDGWVTDWGYRKVDILTPAGRKGVTVHRLVAEAFLPNPKGLPQVNHRNSDKLDNSLDNLEWVSPEENIRHSFLAGTHKSKLSPKDVREIRALRKNGSSLKILAKRYGVSLGTISRIANGVRQGWIS